MPDDEGLGCDMVKEGLDTCPQVPLLAIPMLGGQLGQAQVGHMTIEIS